MRIIYTNQFKKDYKAAQKQNKNLDKLSAVLLENRFNLTHQANYFVQSDHDFSVVRFVFGAQCPPALIFQPL